MITGDRYRRRLARSMRRLVRKASDPSVRDVIPTERVATVGARLLALADWLEHARDPNAEWANAIHRLMTDGCDSPLLNDQLHISELYAALYYIERARPIDGAIVRIGASSRDPCR